MRNSWTNSNDKNSKEPTQQELERIRDNARKAVEDQGAGIWSKIKFPRIRRKTYNDQGYKDLG